MVGSETGFPHQAASRVGAAARCKFQFIVLPMVGSETGFPHQSASRVGAAAHCKFQFIVLPMVGSETDFPHQTASRVGAAVGCKFQFIGLISCPSFLIFLFSSSLRSFTSTGAPTFSPLRRQGGLPRFPEAGGGDPFPPAGRNSRFPPAGKGPARFFPCAWRRDRF